jgi:Fic family protein
LLCQTGDRPEDRVLARPLLYLSLYLKRYRDAYYDRLQRVRTEGAWEPWLRFFLEGVVDVAGSATDTTRRILQLVANDRQRIQTIGRPAGSAQQVHDLISRDVITTIPEATKRLPVSEPTVASAMAHLEELGIVRELTGRMRAGSTPTRSTSGLSMRAPNSQPIEDAGSSEARAADATPITPQD